MEPFRILYVEHGLDGAGYLAAMKGASRPEREVDPHPIECLPKCVVEEVEKAMQAHHFDLVITDSYFIPPGLPHRKGDGSQYLLGKIAEAVRSKASRRVRLAVLTHFAPEVFEDKDHSGDLAKVDFILDKRATRPDFLQWQISRIMEQVDRDFPEHALIDRLLEFLAANANAPWAKPMACMLDKYRSKSGEKEQMERVAGELLSIATSIGAGRAFNDLFETVMAAEPFVLASRPGAWGHLRHAVNVFWLGYLILNSEATRDLAVVAQCGPEPDNKGMTASMAVNTAWFLTSMFHDVGLLGENLGRLLKRCNGLLEVYPLKEFRTQICKDQEATKATLDEGINRLTGLLGENPGAWLGRARELPQAELDHGILSALTLMDAFGDADDRVKYAAQWAARAAAIHNFARLEERMRDHGAKGAEKGKRPVKRVMPKIRFDRHPLAWLLVLCDNIQAWDRQTGQENLFSEMPLECAELAELGIDGHSKRVTAKIVYRPLWYISPADAKTEEVYAKIKNIVITKVEPRLDRLDRSEGQPPRIRVDFSWDARRPIDEWPHGEANCGDENHHE